MFSVFVFLDTTPATVYYNNIKDFLHKVLIYIKLYIHTIGLKVKDNYQIYPVDSRGINFVGYVFYHTHTLIRKSINFKITKYDWCIYAKNRKEKVKPQT